MIFPAKFGVLILILIGSHRRDATGRATEPRPREPIKDFPMEDSDSGFEFDESPGSGAGVGIGVQEPLLKVCMCV